MLTPQEVLDLVEYDPVTGDIIYKYRPNAIATFNTKYAGTVSKGKVCPNGYRLITLNGKYYKAHRLAFVCMEGRWPSQIDHINGIRTDNRWINLEEVTAQQNCFNTARPAGRWMRGTRKRGNQFEARIKKNGVEHRLGLYATELEAASAYRDAADRLFGKYALHNRRQ